MQTNDGLWEQTRIRELIAEVDSWPREPTEDDIRHLAKKYGDTPEYIRATFRCKRWRQEQKNNWCKLAGARGRAVKQNHIPWLDEEKEYVSMRWRRQTDRQIAEGLSRLPCNRERGVMRTAKMVQRYRERAGFTKIGGEVLGEERRYVEQNWGQMTDEELAEGLSALRCNYERGLVCSPRRAKHIRLELGLKREGR